MQTSTPSLGKVITMVLFALSCVGLLLFLWISFGGTIPFNPQGYEFKVSFPNADQLATQADVRIAGVDVGKVISKSLDTDHNRTIATIELDDQYAPIHADAQAILRMKTILGETYVELTPGSSKAPAIPDGGMLPRGQVTSEVQLSDIFNALDPKTRHAFQVWQQQLAKAVQGNEQNLNDVLGNLPTFAADATDILQVLDVEHTATVRLVQNGGTVFAALSQDQSALRNLITSGETVFHTTAANQNQLAKIFEAFPTFLNETKATMARLKSFSLDADPLIRELEPVAQDLGPTLHAVKELSPNLRSFFYTLALRPASKGNNLVNVSQTGLPAVADVLAGAKPLLGSLGPFLEQLNPIFGWLSLHQQLISDFISNGATPLAATTTSLGGAGLKCDGVPCGHYLRQFGPTGPETLAIYQNRDSNNRGNTYLPPLWAVDKNVLTQGVPPSFDCKNTGAPGNGSEPANNTPAAGHMACWVAPPLPGAKGPYQIPHITAAQYSDK
jgi:phospholipid/cholesterol/gamma-HCH transport system substrate-binding protein